MTDWNTDPATGGCHAADAPKCRQCNGTGVINSGQMCLPCPECSQRSADIVRQYAADAPKEAPPAATSPRLTATLLRQERDEARTALESARAEVVAIQAERDTLAAWKKSASNVISEIDLQGVGKALGLKLGSGIGPAILPGIMALAADNARLRLLCQQLELARDERDSLLADHEEIGRVLGCNHIGDGLARCVRDLAAQLDELRDIDAECDTIAADKERMRVALVKLGTEARGQKFQSNMTLDHWVRRTVAEALNLSPEELEKEITGG